MSYFSFYFVPNEKRGNPKYSHFLNGYNCFSTWNSFWQTGQARNSVHWGVWTGIMPVKYSVRLNKKKCLNPYFSCKKVTGCLSVCMYLKITLTTKQIGFSFTGKLFIGPWNILSQEGTSNRPREIDHGKIYVLSNFFNVSFKYFKDYLLIIKRDYARFKIQRTRIIKSC